MGELNIVIPVYNEGANFPRLWTQLLSTVKSKFRVYVIYDFDHDNTVPVVDRIINAGESRLRLVKNNRGAGVVPAIMTGFDNVSSGPVLVLMADLSDDLSQVDRMFDLYSQGYDIVVGSRYMRGGRLVGGPFFKQLLSRLAGTSLWLFRGIPTHDATNAFKIYDCGMVNSFVVESSGGFELNLELTVKAFLRGHAISEVPVVWRDRIDGKSRFRLWKWLPRYLRWYFYAFQRKSTPQARNRRSVTV